jgi:hypothetical protein
MVTHVVRQRLFLAIFVLLLAFLLPQAALGVTLQSAYTGAVPMNGYDKYVELSATMTYTGGLTIPAGDTAYIKGNGAVIDLEGSMIHVGGNTVRLDIDNCVLINGGNPVYGPGQAALNFVASRGSVTNNTIYGNTVGVRVYLSGPGAVTVKNNIIAKNTQVGVLCEVGSEANVIFNDAWGNFMYGSYALDYYCVNGGIQPWSPVPGTGNISVDPLFVDAAARDFHLNASSPCVAAGDPAGTHMGALGSPTPVESTSWGRIKAMFAP